MKHFTIPELCASATANAKGIDNTPGQTELENLISLVENILDPIREQWDAPVIVSSGYRCPKLNAAVGGKNGSDHTKGLAADLQPKKKDEASIRSLFETICNMRNLPFDRVLLEHNKAKTTWWVHIAYDPQRPLVGPGYCTQYAQRIIIKDYESNR